VDHAKAKTRRNQQRIEKIMWEFKIHPRHYDIYHQELAEEVVRESTRGGSYEMLGRFAEYCRESLKSLEEVMAEAPN
jgi:hypothetical protein